MLSEISQREKDKYYMICRMLKKNKKQLTEIDRKRTDLWLGERKLEESGQVAERYKLPL